MSATPVNTHFIDPLDVLVLRGNKLFGGAGSWGASLMPPWPSVAAGALRSALLVHKGLDPAAFGAGTVCDAELGTPSQPGPFTVTAFHLARRHPDGEIEPLFAMPADLIVARAAAGPELRRIRPARMPATVQHSGALPCLPVLAEAERTKAESGWWLTREGYAAHLAGRMSTPGQLVEASALWQTDARVGVGLDAATGRASDGRLFTVQAVALAQRAYGAPADTGFVVQVMGAALPARLSLHLGGDGRAAIATTTAHAASVAWPQADLEALSGVGRLRIVLASPGVFEGGWLPTGAQAREDGSIPFDLHGVRGRIVCAAVPRADVVSGYDLAERRPKAAQRTAATGSVYWLDDVQATPAALRKLADLGLWAEADYAVSTRRAEGFNRIHLAVY